MNQIIVLFLCRIKEDTYKIVTDQLTYWSGIAYIYFTGLHPNFGFIENWFFIHGWLILLVGRFILLIMDIYKRSRDINKPEWKSNISYILKREALENRKKSFFQKLIDQIKQLIKW